MSLDIVFQRTIEMCRDRGYKLPQLVHDIHENPQQLIDFHQGTIYVKKKTQEESPKYELIMIHFAVTKFGIKDIRIKIDQFKQKNINHIILVLAHKFTLHGQRKLNEQKQIEKEIFYFHELIINPIHHDLVPKHELLSESETKALVQTIGKKLPGIKVTDRICRHYHGKIGQIFRIYRTNQQLFFRIVTP